MNLEAQEIKQKHTRIFIQLNNCVYASILIFYVNLVVKRINPYM